MGISQISSQPVMPSKPAEPTPPPGGNIENRKPPTEPTQPAAKKEIEKKEGVISSDKIDTYI